MPGMFPDPSPAGPRSRKQVILPGVTPYGLPGILGEIMGELQGPAPAALGVTATPALGQAVSRVAGRVSGGGFLPPMFGTSGKGVLTGAQASVMDLYARVLDPNNPLVKHVNFLGDKLARRLDILEEIQSTFASQGALGDMSRYRRPVSVTPRSGRYGIKTWDALVDAVSRASIPVAMGEAALVRPLPGISQSTAFRGLQSALQPFATPSIDVSMREGAPGLIAIRGPGGEAIQMSLERAGMSHSRPGGVSFEGWNLGGLGPESKFTPLTFQTPQLFMGAAIMDPGAEGGMRVLSAQEFALGQMSRRIEELQAQGFSESEIFRQGNKIYEETLAHHRLGGVKFENYNKLHQLRIYNLNAEGGVTDLHTTLNREFDSKVFGNWTAHPEHVPQILREQLKMIEGSTLPGPMKRKLTHAMVKAESFMKGIMGTISPGEAIAFGQYSDPARQLYQHFGRAPLTQASVERLAGVKVRMSRGRKQASFFPTGRAVVPVIATAHELNVESGFRQGQRTLAESTIGLQREILTTPHAVGAAFGGQEALLAQIAGGRPALPMTPAEASRLGMVTSQVQTQMGFVVGMGTRQGVKWDPRLAQAIIGETSGGAALAAEGFLGSLQRLRNLNPSTPEGLRDLISGQLTSPLTAESLTINTISAKVTPKTGPAFRQRLAGPAGAALALVGSWDMITKAQKSDLGKFIGMEVSSAVEAIMATEMHRGSISDRGYVALTEIAKSIGGIVHGQKDPVTGKTVYQITPSDKVFKAGLTAGTEIHNLPVLQRLKEITSKFGVQYQTPFDIQKKFAGAGGTIPAAEARKLGLLPIQYAGQTFWVMQRAVGISAKADDPASLINKFAPKTKTGFHPEGAIISEDTIRNLKLGAGGSTAMRELGSYFEKRRAFNPYAATIAELLKSEAQKQFGYNATGGVTPYELTKIMDRLGGFKQLSKELVGGGPIPTEAIANTIFDPRLRELSNIWTQGLTVRFGKAIEVPFEAGAQTVSSIHIPPSFLLGEHIAHPGGVHKMDLIRTSEQLLEFAMVAGKDPTGRGAELAVLLQQHSKAMRSFFMEGEHPLIAKLMKYRADVSGTFRPEEAMSPEVIQRLARQPGELTADTILKRARSAGIRPLGFAEAEISSRRLLDIMGGRDLTDLVKQGLVYTEKVGDTIQHYTYALAQAHPELPASSIAPVKVFLTRDISVGNRMRMSAATLRTKFRDTDADLVQLIFARDQQMAETMQRAQGEYAAKAKNFPELFLMDARDRMSRAMGIDLNEHLEHSRKAVDKAIGFARQEMLEEALLGRKLSLKYVTPALHGVQMGLTDHLLTQFEAGKLVSLQTDRDAVIRTADLIGSAYQLGSIKKADLPRMELFRALSKVEAGATFNNLPRQVKAQLYGGILEVAQEQFGGLGGRYFFKDRLTPEQINKAFKLLEGRGFKDVTGLDKAVIAGLDELAGPLTAVVAEAKRMGEGHKTMDPFGKAAKGIVDRIGRPAEVQSAYILSQMLGMFQDAAVRGGDVVERLSTVERIFQQKLESLGFDLKAVTPEEAFAALGMGPGHVIPNVESEMITSAGKAADPTRVATNRPIFDRISGWFHDPKTAAWKKVAAAGGALLIGGAIVKNTFFPDLVPDRPAAAPPDVGGEMGSAIGTDIWKQLPTVTNSGGRMPMIAPSYGPGLANPQISPMLGPAMKVPSFEGQYAGTMGSAPLAPTDFSMQSSYAHHQAVEVPHEIPVYMEASERLSPGYSDLVRGREITVSTQRSADQEAVARLLARQADIYQSPGLIHSRLDDRRAVNERGSLMRAPGMRA